MFLGYRSNDPVLTICQDNQSKRVEILDINHAVEELLGFSSADMAGKSLSEFLPTRIATLLHEYVEFEDDGNDVGNVLSKVQSFCLHDHKGREVLFRLKVLRSESLDRNAYFKLILQSSQGNRRNEAFRAILRENFKGHEVIDPHTGLPDRNSLNKGIELVLFYVHKNELKASFALLELDGAKAIAEKYGSDVPHAIRRHIANIAKQNLRTDDTVGSLPQDRLGLILLDTNTESARMVLNRLRWLIAAHPYVLPDNVMLPVTVSIGFAQLGSRTADKNIISEAEVFIDRLHGQNNGNALQEIPDIDFRTASHDRRKHAISVPFDRRRNDRRNS